MNSKLKVVVILVGAILQITLIYPVTDAQLHINPLWDTSANDTDAYITSCALDDRNASEEGVTTIHGSAHQTCSFRVNASTGYNILLEIPSFRSSEIPPLLYVEQDVDRVKCAFKYAVFDGHHGTCTSMFLFESLQFHMQGDISLLITWIQDEFQKPPECSSPDIDNANSQSSFDVSQVSDCHDVKGYGHKLTCSTHSSTCRVDFLVNCNATLGLNEVLFECVAGDGLILNEEALIVYLSNTTRLDLSYNDIAALKAGTFKRLPRLQELYLEGNYLSTIDVDAFVDLPEVKVLSLYGNQLVELDNWLFQSLMNLSRLDLDENLLTVLPPGLFAGLTNLTSLYLFGNRLVAVDENLFQGLSNLYRLDLDDNDLSALPVGLFRGLNSLKILTLFGNPLGSLNELLFHDLEVVFSLDIDAIQLNDLSVNLLKPLKSLEKLYLTGNHLITLRSGVFDGLSELYLLYIDNNRIEMLPPDIFHPLSDLMYLFLHDNKLSSLPLGLFDGLRSLEELFLYKNQLSALTPGLFLSLHNLTVISLRVNKLVALLDGVFNGLTSLEFLFLQANQLQNISPDAFQELYSLRFLFLSDNLLQTIPSDAFEDTRYLNFIELGNNKLNQCPNLKNLKQLNFLNLRDNALLDITVDSFVNLPTYSELNVDQHEICDCYVSPGVNCSAASDRSPYLTCDRLLSDKTLVVLMWLIGVNALGGNIFVLVWRKKNTKKYKVQDLLLSNLAISDSLMGMYMVIIAVADMYYGEYFPMQSETWRSGIPCRIAGALSITSSEASVLFVTLISIDRFISIKFPYSTRKLGRMSTFLISLLTWVFSLITGIVPSVLSGDNFKFYDNSHVCIGLPLALTKTYSVTKTTKIVEPENSNLIYPKDTFTTQFTGLATGLYFSTALFLGFNCLCYLIILACYVEIMREVRRSSKKSGRTREMKDQIRLSMKVAAIVATDFLCWFPIILLGILVQTRVLTLPPSVYAWSVTFVLPLNSAINPYLYTISEIVSNYHAKRDKYVKRQLTGKTGNSSAIETTVT